MPKYTSETAGSSSVEQIVYQPQNRGLSSVFCAKPCGCLYKLSTCLTLVLKKNNTRKDTLSIKHEKAAMEKRKPLSRKNSYN